MAISKKSLVTLLVPSLLVPLLMAAETAHIECTPEGATPTQAVPIQFSGASIPGTEVANGGQSTPQYSSIDAHGNQIVVSSGTSPVHVSPGKDCLVAAGSEGAEADRRYPSSGPRGQPV
jgi:hypothetical protein